MSLGRFRPVFPVIHYLIVELILLALALHAAFKFFSWAAGGINQPWRKHMGTLFPEDDDFEFPDYLPMPSAVIEIAGSH